MSNTKPIKATGRREFLGMMAGASALGLTFGRAGSTATGKALRGLFPIAQTPFTESGKLDLDSLIREVEFIDRGRVPGFVWPQKASEWSVLTVQERLEGAEAITSTGKRLRPAIVIGVQATNLRTAVKYAKHAEKAGADAIMSLPPEDQKDPNAILDYYQQVARSVSLPMFAQTEGGMSVDLVIRMFKSIPNLHYVKDEAGNPLARVGQLRRQSSDQLKVFAGNGVTMMINEMELGFSGLCPAAWLADLYAASWDLWFAGKRQQAAELFGRILMVESMCRPAGPESGKYILCLRNVFKTYTWRSYAMFSPPGYRRGQSVQHLNAQGKEWVRQAVEFVNPYLRA
jgi:dihydrodipicolinate synthase/N-acetylneuraminate lyase